ncbi:S1C family serine protease [Thalassotalea marina]|uniref:2-alkenal reductase n=1 Tax=Thalassotalea marina TaxID=1673741 RepID=A0A919BIU0_9GAMM|nr:2-alkenal reductase [Thalassotalea marina]
MNQETNFIKLLRLGIWLLAISYVISLLVPMMDRWFATKHAEPRMVTARGELAAQEKTTIDIFNQASPSVVFISTSNIVRSYWSRDVRKVPRGSGSGFIWDEFGHVVTNYHVIEGASEANIRLNDGRTYQASLVGVSPNHDLAVLKINVDLDLPPAVPLGTSEDLQVGQSVFAIGNPFGLDHTLTSGIVSALNRSLSDDSELIINNLIQTDAAINPGNSGGPLLDSAGRLVGINTAIYSPSGAYAGIGFAVPVDTVNRVVPQLIQSGKYTQPSLGISIDQDLNAQIIQQLGIEGIAILDISPNSSAAKAGLQPAQMTRFGIKLGDVIQSIDGNRISNVKSLMSTLDNYRVGDQVTVGILRNNQQLEITTRLQ